jgi:hypothetical protein
VAKAEYRYSSVGIQRDRVNEHGRREAIEPHPYLTIVSAAGRLVQINLSRKELVRLIADAAYQLGRLQDPHG